MYPKAIDKSKVGSYPALTFSGGGYFYDEVLEYRVWIHPKNGDQDFFYAFEDYETALKCSKLEEDAKEPLVLVLQNEYIDEPEEGEFYIIKKERVTEWQVEWLAHSKRDKNTLTDFIKSQQK